MKRCEAGHFYSPEQHSSCPHCGIPDLDLGPTRPKHLDSAEPSFAPSVDQPMAPTVPGGGANAGGRRRAGNTLPRDQAGQGGRDEGKTVGVVQKKLGVDPVVGWLVCIEGPDRGRDYRVRSGRNFIGRAQQMHICIGGDPAVSREKHAAVSYDPKQGCFKLLPGEGSGLTYVNEDTVEVPVELKPYDTIEVGETKLTFVPFCGEHFRWTAPESAEPSA